MTNSISKVQDVWKPTFINDVEQEDWRYAHYNGNITTYEVSSFGRVRNRKGDILKPNPSNSYHCVKLGKNNDCTIHRLVADAFLVKKKNKNIVNHIDGNKTNNKATNIEFCSASENTLHAHANNLINQYKIRVNQYDLNGIFIKSFESITDASKETNTKYDNIIEVCKNKRDSANNFKWKYINHPSIPLIYQKIPKQIYPIAGYDKYWIASDGRVFSKTMNNYMKPGEHENGYLEITLRNEEEKKAFLIHRLVAQTYIPNNDVSKCIVNHKNGIKGDNDVSNLEWVTQSENMQHSFAVLNPNKFTKKVIQYDMNLVEIETFNSIKEAADSNNIKRGNISACCIHQNKSAGNFIWKFADEEFVEEEIIYKDKISQFDLDGKLIKIHNTIEEASIASNIRSEYIRDVCSGRRKTTGNWKWTSSYTEEHKNDIIDFNKKKSVAIDGFLNFKITEEGKIYNSQKNRYVDQKTISSGYSKVTLSENSKDKECLVYKLMTDAYKLNPLNKKNVFFNDKDITNNKLTNLFWA